MIRFADSFNLCTSVFLSDSFFSVSQVCYRALRCSILEPSRSDLVARTDMLLVLMDASTFGGLAVFKTAVGHLSDWLV